MWTPPSTQAATAAAVANFGLLGVLVGQEALARRAGHDRQIQRRQRPEAAQNERVLLLALAESEAGVDHQRLGLMPTPARG
jgi:hypothetical protein